ncbi:MAG: TatD family hydrolase [Oscillospiraceae bacterium]|nr:TatD family hydrolase [Oscillospiraceae bacterium]
MKHMLFDSHAHYADSQFDADREELLGNLLASQGIGYIMLAGIQIPDCYQSQKLAERYETVYCSAGIHPEYVSDIPADWEQQIRLLARHEKCRAIGEIGLDYYWHPEEKEIQKELLKKQLELAKELDLPVILHIRDAMGDAVEILKAYRPRGVMHCYNGAPEITRELLKIPELYFSFSGVITYKNARKPVESLKILPSDRIMIETDCPYLAPEPFRHKRCDSRMMHHTAQRMAEIRDISVQELEELTCANAKKLFHVN